LAWALFEDTTAGSCCCHWGPLRASCAYRVCKSGSLCWRKTCG